MAYHISLLIDKEGTDDFQVLSIDYYSENECTLEELGEKIMRYVRSMEVQNVN
jgi:hypothetical protein